MASNTDSVAILTAHTDEVWDVRWNRDGTLLASASKDKTVIVWCEADPTSTTAALREGWLVFLTDSDFKYPVGRLAWAPNKDMLLAACEGVVKIIDTTDTHITTCEEHHTDTITALCWLPDGTGFITGSIDRKIIVWSADGQVRDIWDDTPIRIFDLTTTSNLENLVLIGIVVPSLEGVETENSSTIRPTHEGIQSKIIVSNFVTKEIKSSIRLTSDLTSVRLSSNSDFEALVNECPDKLCLWNLKEMRIQTRYQGHKQQQYVIRSCFGGPSGNRIISGSEDGNVYLWDRTTGVLLHVLNHGVRSVNSVAWSPAKNYIASCSDDHTIRIWNLI